MKQKKSKPQRKDWDTYFLEMADHISQRATCDRLHVGAIIVNDNRIISTGYNGSLPRAPHCDDVGHLMVKDHCKRTIHAEVNAIAECACQGISTKDSRIYLTHSPCLECFKLIVASKISRIIFNKPYRLTQKEIDIYKLVAGYRDIEICADDKISERFFDWEIDLNSNIWYKV